MAKISISIKLYVSELLYDIRNKVFLTGRSRFAGNNHEEVAHMQASDDEDDQDQLLRSIGNAVDLLKTKLSEYSVVESTADNVLLTQSTRKYFPEGATTKTTSYITLTLSMPSNYNQTTADTIASACHQYVVDMAVGEWFTITNKTDAADYLGMAQTQLEVIREALAKRLRPERPTYNSSGTTTDTNSGSELTADPDSTLEPKPAPNDDGLIDDETP